MACGVVVGFRKKIFGVENKSGLTLRHVALEFEHVRRKFAMPGHGGFDFDGNQVALSLENQIDFFVVAVLPEIQVGLAAGVEPWGPLPSLPSQP